ncbi:uncharacterized protein VP01_1054g1 [Puccinia sorghi]|uniref:No apical meristem-associated C-terminal domain-containing protein n=1 Tax=Puccinia sorghi TaxID=27349 RepID=A0A0L6VVF8_9BASI|nr:uncharacterized protein VP01_1054g1 [Puccinia sorghi]
MMDTSMIKPINQPQPITLAHNILQLTLPCLPPIIQITPAHQKLDQEESRLPKAVVKDNHKMNQKRLEEMASANKIQMQLINMNILRRDISTWVDGFEQDFYIHAKIEVSQQASNEDDNESGLPDINFNPKSSIQSQTHPDRQDNLTKQIRRQLTI